ncbi:MAG TPA: hypothetical protein DCL69_03595 [Firmicutes bacterium]|nr:hypothetical protein [Bacillota bacterium]HBL68330.1 hypothetical protein [Bacillota bacterium]
MTIQFATGQGTLISAAPGRRELTAGGAAPKGEEVDIFRLSCKNKLIILKRGVNMKKHILLIGFMILTLVVVAGCQRKPGNNSSNGNENDGFIDPSVTLESLRGKPVFLNFWATWCGPCREELPDLQQMYLKYGDRIQFFTISAESANTVRKFMGKNAYTFPVFLDVNEKLNNEHKIRAIPTTMILDTEGRVRESHIGTMSAEQMEAFILAVLE